MRARGSIRPCRRRKGWVSGGRSGRRRRSVVEGLVVSNACFGGDSMGMDMGRWGLGKGESGGMGAYTAGSILYDKHKAGASAIHGICAFVVEGGQAHAIVLQAVDQRPRLCQLQAWWYE